VSHSDIFTTPLTQQLGIRYPIIGGPMYPCSNPELVAAVSQAGGIGVVQPISLTYVYGYDFRAGLQYIKSLTSNPIGMNALIEQSSKRYRQRMEAWIDIALDEGVRFFITSLGKPDWVVKNAHQVGALVYHDATEEKWAQKGVDCGVDGLIAVNNRAGGHAGNIDSVPLMEALTPFGVPVVCAGGIGDRQGFIDALKLGYAGVQMGTRFIATKECQASKMYKQAIVDADENDIVLSEKITGVPVSIINTPYVQAQGVKLGTLGQRMLRGKSTKHLMRTLLALRSIWQFKHASLDEKGKTEYWQAGKSVAGIDKVEPVTNIIQQFVQATK
jgi:nitronate monooxygenase